MNCRISSSLARNESFVKRFHRDFINKNQEIYTTGCEVFHEMLL